MILKVRTLVARVYLPSSFDKRFTCHLITCNTVVIQPHFWVHCVLNHTRLNLIQKKILFITWAFWVTEANPLINHHPRIVISYLALRHQQATAGSSEPGNRAYIHDLCERSSKLIMSRLRWIDNFTVQWQSGLSCEASKVIDFSSPAHRLVVSENLIEHNRARIYNICDGSQDESKAVPMCLPEKAPYDPTLRAADVTLRLSVDRRF